MKHLSDALLDTLHASRAEVEALLSEPGVLVLRDAETPVLALTEAEPTATGFVGWVD